MIVNGYRLIPELKVLSDEELYKAKFNYEATPAVKSYGLYNYLSSADKRIMTAQRDYDIKQIKGEV